ncbi:MAG: 5-formyltetrahydrofolate cyclo-ligase [Firmicutes bacterium]|nr:5-formyltetrahydrofolate cyclo-ligase [Bacillota bacterium]
MPAPDKQTLRKALRKEKIKAREALTPEERAEKSRAICANILRTPEYTKARTVMIYKFVKGEVQLKALEEVNEALPKAERKTFVYPLCIEDRGMLAIAPESSDTGTDSWKRGAFGIPEPVPEKGRAVAPEDIDLVVSPCSSFDETFMRLGMGGGCYDRFLPKCAKADVMLVAYECQRAEKIPAEDWDVPVPCIVTEDGVLRKE